MVAGSEEQARKRKLIGSSFYKDKLLKMVDIINKCVADKISYFSDRYLEGNKEFNLITELDELHTKIILSAAFGQEDISEPQVPFIEDSVTQMRPLGRALRDVFHYIAFRGMRKEIAIIPFLLFLFYNKKDRECL
jgi:cytochrome P450